MAIVLASVDIIHSGIGQDRSHALSFCVESFCSFSLWEKVALCLLKSIFHAD